MNHSHAPAIIDELYTSLRCVRFYPGVNSRAELVTLARAYARNWASRRWLED